MAPAFLKELRRRSKVSLSFTKNSNRSTDSSTDETGTATHSTSTANSADGAASPPVLTTSNSASDLQNLGSLSPPARPTIPTSASNRNSVFSMSGLGASSPQSSLPPSPYAPRLDIKDGVTVHTKAILLRGAIGQPAEGYAKLLEGHHRLIDGDITVTREDTVFPPMYFPVLQSQFKALLPLVPGCNKLKFSFTSPKLSNNSTTNPIHVTTFSIFMVPQMSSPPLQLVILLGKDSPGTFDAPPGRGEGNDLTMAVMKFRMAAYLWQAYTADQMGRGRFGPRAFRMDEEWITGTSIARDRKNGTMRSEAKVHIVRCDRSCEELQDVERAQQNPNGTKRDELFIIAGEAMKNYFQPLPNQTQYCAVVLMDSKWDKKANLIRGHTAVSGAVDGVTVAIFGSHALHSYPSSFEEVVPAFMNCTPTDIDYVANDCAESGSSWEAANIGIGAHLHEVGHLFGCPHEASGIMLRDYVTFGRSFIIQEPYSTRTQLTKGFVGLADECSWHRLDLLRFRAHPCFAVPYDPIRQTDGSVQAWPVEKDEVCVTAPSGIAFLEIFLDGDNECHFFQEFSGKREVKLSEQSLRREISENRKTDAFKKICIKSVAGGSLDIENFTQLASKASKLKLPNGRIAFRGRKLGLSQMDGSIPEEVVFSSAIEQTTLMTQVRVYHGNSIDGVEFIYEDSTSQLFGKKGGTPGGSVFDLDTRRGEVVRGFLVRSGHWIDSLQIVTSQRMSVWYGQPHGSLHTLIPPIGYSLAGVTGSCAAWVDGFGLIITR